jgi:signal transduction histidine kinase/ligand-binding sensor domain-containing protein
MLRCYLNTLLLLLLGHASLWGRQKEFLPFHNYTQKEGLSSYNITKICQDKYGFFWVATQDGLNCFDGRRFRVFTREADAPYTLRGNNVTDIVEDTLHERLFLATAYGGIECIHTPTQRILDDAVLKAANAYLSGKWVRCLAITGHTLWIGLYEGLCALDLRNGKFTTPAGLRWKGIRPEALRVKKMLVCKDGKLLLCCDGEGLIVLNSRSGAPLANIPAALLNNDNREEPLTFANGAAGAGDTLYLATNWGLRILYFNGSRPVLLPPGKQAWMFREEIFACTQDGLGRLWLAGRKGLYRTDPRGDDYRTIQDANSPADDGENIVYALYTDRRNNIWAGSEEGLSYISSRPSPFRKFYRSAIITPKVKHAFAIYRSGGEEVLCGAANGLYRINTGSHAIQRIDTGGACYLVDRLPDRHVIVSNTHGIFVLEHDRLVPASSVYPALKPLQHVRLSALCSQGDSLVLLGSLFDNGVYVWHVKTGAIQNYSRKKGNLPLDDELVNAMFRDSRGQVFIISVNNVIRFDPVSGHYQAWKAGIPGNSVLMDMCETAGHYWLAAYGAGLVRVDKTFKTWHIFSEKNGLSDNGVYKVFAHADSLVLVTSNKGLSALHLPSGQFRNAAAEDGLHDNAFEQFSGFQQDNIIYAGGLNGFTRIDPAGFVIDTIPPDIKITGISIKTPAGVRDTTQLDMRSIRIPADVQQTVIAFSALHFSNPDKVHFAYKIAELQNDWIDLGERNEITLVGLAPGTYTLLVKAMNEYGYASTVQQPLKLVFLPKWYQTLWFKVAVALAVLALLLGFFQFRIYQLRRQQQIRKEIASDLHDDIGGTLNTVKIFAHLAREGDRENRLQQVDASITDAIAGLRDLLWVLDDKDDTAGGLMERIRKMVSPLTLGQRIELHCIAGEGTDKLLLTKKEKRNLLLIAKEAVNNTIKYAQCSRLDITLSQVNSRPVLHIRDNGKGFDSSRKQADSYGLRNMKDRARQIGYQLELKTEAGSGVEVLVKKQR